MRPGKCKWKRQWGILWIAALVFSLDLQAIETPAVLPLGVRTAVVRLGNYNNLNEYYSEQGNLRYLSDKNSFELSMSEMARIDARVEELRNILNEFGRSDLGDQLHLGQISVEADPTVQYFAAAGAIGLTKRWTVGLAIPVIFYSNSIAVTQSGSNLDAIEAQVAGANEDLDKGFQEVRAALNSDMRAGVNGFLGRRGYDSLSNRSEQFIGDVQVFSMYQLDSSPEFTQTLQVFLGLPTGPAPDPDDLADLENFGRYSLRLGWVAKRPFVRDVDLLLSGSYNFIPQHSLVKRVPEDQNDSLPDADQKYDMKADFGDVISVGVGLTKPITPEVYLAGGYSYEYKMSDSYSGAPDGRGKYLEQNTEKSAHLAKLEAGYSTVQAYFRKQFAIPLIVAYEFTQTLTGVNVENQNKHELNFSLFF